MNEHFISDELYSELQMLPDEILTSTALMLREQWLGNPDNGEALIGLLIVGEVMINRGLELPACEDDAKVEAALMHFLMTMTDPPSFFRS